MTVPSIEQPKCKQDEKDGRPLWKLVVHGVASGVGRYVCSRLLNERTWHYLAVKFPEWAEKLFDVFIS